MSFSRAVPLLLILALAGCDRALQGSNTEEKEPYFLAARKRQQERDHAGAIEYFEKALDVNPRSASAHLELGVLYEQQQSDYAAALYHYQKGLALKPELPSADLYRQHIEQCKRELAKTVTQLPSTEQLQRDVDALRVENVHLKQQLQAWQMHYSGRGPAPAAPAAVPANSIAPAPAARAAAAPQPGTPAAPAVAARMASNGAAPPGPRTHTVASGETLARIATKYGVKLSVLQSANPAVDARRLRLGQALVIPPASPSP